MTDEYLDHFEKYRDQYGERTCVLMQVGSFYEMQMVKNDDEHVGNLHEVCGILNIQVTKKNKNIPNVDRKNPYLAGFPKHAVAKFMPLLLDHGYTVVVIDQSDDAKKKRSVTAVYSPGVQPVDADHSDVYGNVIASVLFEFCNDSIGYSIAFMNMTTNSFEVYESGARGATLFQVLDSVYRILYRYNLKELMFVSHGSHVHFDKETVCEYLDIGAHVPVHFLCSVPEKHGQYEKISFQNELFRMVYSRHVSFGLLEPVEYFHLEKSQLSCINCMYLLEFVGDHDRQYLSRIAFPKVMEESSHLVLETNTLSQLSVVSQRAPSSHRKHKYSSVFDVVNKTRTAVGKRALKNVLVKPLKVAADIQRRLQISDDFEAKVSDELAPQLQSILEGIADFERLHRKMGLGVLQPAEFAVLHNTYEKLLELDVLMSKVGLDELCLSSSNVLESYIQAYTKVFDMSALAGSEGCIFVRGYTVEIDELYGKLESLERDIADICKRYNEVLKNEYFKVHITEEGHFLTCTKIRSQLLKQALSEEEYGKLRIKTNTSTCRITSDELQKLSMQVFNYRGVFDQKVKAIFRKCLQSFYDEYGSLFEQIKTFVELIDVTQSNVRCKKAYGYCRPIVVEGGESYFEAKQLRHPIIERIQTSSPYVPNDVTMSSERPGIVLYALNSCGKSSLLRSVGLCVVMAQCGLYVPCDSMSFTPFDTVITQVDMHDNLWKAQSSFVVEMTGLRNILRVASKKCLVLSDELTKGTEIVSATSIFAAAVLELAKRSCKFMFTTHLQDVATLDEIKGNEAIQICHLSVDIQGETIVFERLLRSGPSTSLYGLEVARAVGLNSDVLQKAFDIRDTLVNESSKLNVAPRKSRYNKEKRLDACEICNYRPMKKTDLPLDTHHIKFQRTADKNNFTGHYHKNSKFNLVCLCKQCHNAVHEDLIQIQGYKQTTDGIKLEYTELL